MKSAYPISGERPRGGFTIVELIVSFIIIGILASIMVPTIVNRAEQARVATAQQELQHLSDAQERAGIDMGYFLRPYALDDVGGPGETTAIASTDETQDDIIESIRDNAVTNNNAYDTPEQIFISLSTQDYAANNTELFDSLVNNETNFNFNGPYINWQRDDNENDWPDDPWGNDYLFFTRRGVIWPPTSNNPSADPDPDAGDGSENFEVVYKNVDIETAGGGVSPFQFAATIFDRPTWLSMGPDGLPGDGTNFTGNNGFGNGDDLIYQFGSVRFDTRDSSTTP